MTAVTIPIVYGYIYLTTLAPTTTGSPAYYQIASATTDSDTSDTVVISVTSTKQDLDKTLALELQVPQTTLTEAAKDRRLKDFKKFTYDIQITGFIQTAIPPGTDPATASSTRINKKKSILTLFKNGNDGKVFNLIIPDELLSDGTHKASSIETITGVIKKLSISEDANDKINNKYGITLMFMQGVDFGSE